MPEAVDVFQQQLRDAFGYHVSQIIIPSARNLKFDIGKRISESIRQKDKNPCIVYYHGGGYEDRNVLYWKPWVTLRHIPEVEY